MAILSYLVYLLLRRISLYCYNEDLDNIQKHLKGRNLIIDHDL